MEGARGSVVVEALCYKPDWRPDDISEFLTLPNPSSRIGPWGFTRPLSEMSTTARKICLWGVEPGRCVGLTT
jgi:hypothetical protein